MSQEGQSRRSSFRKRKETSEREKKRGETTFEADQDTCAVCAMAMRDGGIV